jgi:hypothetical protein
MPALAVAQDQPADPQTFGPGRLVCNASFCVLGIGAHPRQQRVRVVVSALPTTLMRRLRKCTGVRACNVTVHGVEEGTPPRIVASAIDFQD